MNWASSPLFGRQPLTQFPCRDKKNYLNHRIFLNLCKPNWFFKFSNKIRGSIFGHQGAFVLFNFYKSLRLLNIIKTWQEYYCYPEYLKVFQKCGYVNLEKSIISQGLTVLFKKQTKYSGKARRFLKNSGKGWRFLGFPASKRLPNSRVQILGQLFLTSESV